MSELDLRFGDPGSRDHRRQRRAGPPPRQQSTNRKRKRKKQRKRGGGRSFVAFLTVVLLLGGLGLTGWWGVNWLRNTLTTPDYDGTGHGSVQVEVQEGDSGTAIANSLYEADVIASGQAFVEACEASELCVNIQPGTYELRLQMRARDAVDMLLDPESRVVDWVTIPEGLSTFRTYELLSEELDIPVEEFEQAEEAALELVPDWWFERDDGKDVERSIEGFLFPETYDFPPDVTAQSALETMVNQFLTVTGEMEFADRVQNERQIMPFIALIAASIAQAEAGTVDDLGKVARVAYNRVYSAQMPLEMDVTTNYGRERQGEEPLPSGELTNDMLFDQDNVYSTHAHRGWMPGPINNPGQAALEAAMAPPDGNWLFFVLVDPETGESAFAETNSGHEANIQQACQNGVELSQC